MCCVRARACANGRVVLSACVHVCCVLSVFCVRVLCCVAFCVLCVCIVLCVRGGGDMDAKSVRWARSWAGKRVSE